MIAYFNCIVDDNKEGWEQKVIDDLNAMDSQLFDSVESAMIEATICAPLAWAIYDLPVNIYKISYNENNEINSLEKVGYKMAEADADSLSKQEVLNLYSITDEELIQLRENI